MKVEITIERDAEGKLVSAKAKAQLPEGLPMEKMRRKIEEVDATLLEALRVRSLPAAPPSPKPVPDDKRLN